MSTEKIPLILSLDIAGNPQRWITYEDAACYYAKDLVAWEYGGRDYRLHGGIQRASGLQTTMDISPIIAVRGMGKTNLHDLIPPLNNRELYRRDRHICAYCGNSFSTHRLSRDHITPQSRGGSNIWENVVTACLSCNKKKDNKTPEQAGMPLLFIPYAPSRAEWLILKNRKILADQMEFLMKGVPQHSRLHQ